MEFIQLAWICAYESGKSIFTRKFDVESFWTKCIRVNLVYTKFFQAIASKYHLHSAIHNIPYELDEIDIPLDITVGTVIGSGLISIVFEGTKNGKPVVIKTKRRNIDRRVAENLLSVHRMVEWVNWVYPIPILTDVLGEITLLFFTQLDFTREMANHKRFQAMFSEKPYIVIPTLVEEDCTPNQIVMSRLHGIPLSECTQVQKQMYANQLTELLLQSLLVDGFVHADLHVGNLMFQEKSLGILDFGLMFDLTPEEKNIMTELMTAFAIQDFDNAARHTFRLIGPDDRKKELSDEILEDLHGFIIHVFKRAVQVHHSFQVGDVMEMNRKFRKHGLSLTPLFDRIIMALHSVETTLSQLSPNPAELLMQVTVSILTR